MLVLSARLMSPPGHGVLQGTPPEFIASQLALRFWTLSSRLTFIILSACPMALPDKYGDVREELPGARMMALPGASEWAADAGECQI